MRPDSYTNMKIGLTLQKQRNNKETPKDGPRAQPRPEPRLTRPRNVAAHGQSCRQDKVWAMSECLSSQVPEGQVLLEGQGQRSRETPHLSRDHVTPTLN